MLEEKEKIEETRTVTTEESSTGKERLRTIISVIIIIIAASILGWIYRERNKNSETTNSNPPPPQVSIEVPSDVVTPPPANVTPPPAAPVPPPAPVEVTPVTPQANSESSTPPAPRASGESIVNPAFLTLSHSYLGFQYIIPSNWKETVTSERVTVYNSDNSGIVGIIEVLQPQSESLESIRNQLERSPEISNIQVIAINGKQFLHYNILGSSGFGYATVHGGKVYYITDYSNGKLLEHFKLL